MGLKDFGRKIENKIRDGIEYVEEKCSDAGEAISGAAEDLGNKLSKFIKGDGKNPIRKVIGTVIKRASDLIATGLKSAFDIIGGSIGGGFKILLGTVTLDYKLVIYGFIDIFSPVIGSVLTLAGRTASLFQSFHNLEENERSLSKDEQSNMHRVFKDSINYDRITLVLGDAGIFSVLSKDTYVLCNTIYLNDWVIDYPTLVHECTHIWQYQNLGTRYACDALGIQVIKGDESAYDWKKEINYHKKRKWKDFNKEAQASFLEHIWEKGILLYVNEARQEQGNGCFYDADWVNTIGSIGRDLYDKVARDAVKTIRDG